MTWDDWNAITAEQQAADAQAEERQRERIARHEARQPGDIIAEAENVAASEVDRLRLVGAERVQALSSATPPPVVAPEAVVPPRSAPDPVRALRVYLSKMRAGLRKEDDPR